MSTLSLLLPWMFLSVDLGESPTCAHFDLVVLHQFMDCWKRLLRTRKVYKHDKRHIMTCVIGVMEETCFE